MLKALLKVVLAGVGAASLALSAAAQPVSGQPYSAGWSERPDSRHSTDAGPGVRDLGPQSYGRRDGASAPHRDSGGYGRAGRSAEGRGAGRGPSPHSTRRSRQHRPPRPPEHRPDCELGLHGCYGRDGLKHGHF